METPARRDSEILTAIADGRDVTIPPRGTQYLRRGALTEPAKRPSSPT